MTEKEVKELVEIQELALRKKDHKITAKYVEPFCDGHGHRWYIFRELKSRTLFKVYEYDGLLIQPDGTQLIAGRSYELLWSMYRATDGMIRQAVEIRETLEGWMTTDEAAEMLGLEVSTVRAYASRGVFPGTKKIGNTLHIPPSAIEAWIDDTNARELRKKQPRTEWAAMRKNVAAAREFLEKITDETSVDEMRSLVKSALDILRCSSLAS